MLKIDNLHKSFGEKIVLNGFTAELPTKSKTLITGKSGAGKTTLLRIIAGLEIADSGKVTIDGEGVISYMFQEPRLLPWMNVHDNINAVLKYPDTEKTVYLLEELGLKDEIYSMPGELSGGMKRRVALARSLIYPADVYLFDEPFAGLDPAMAKTAADVILKYTDGKTVLIVSHDTSMFDDKISSITL